MQHAGHREVAGIRGLAGNLAKRILTRYRSARLQIVRRPAARGRFRRFCSWRPASSLVIPDFHRRRWRVDVDCTGVALPGGIRSPIRSEITAASSSVYATNTATIA